MDDEAVGRSRQPDWQSDLADVTGMDLSELVASTDSVLANSIQRLLAETADPQEVIAGHGNGIR